MLRSFNNLTINFKQVGSFQSFKAKKVKVKIPIKPDGLIKFLIMLLDNLMNVITK